MLQSLRNIGLLAIMASLIACGDEYTPTGPDEEPQAAEAASQAASDSIASGNAPAR